MKRPNLTTINYRGLEEEWNAIDKDPMWDYIGDYGIGDCTIVYNYTGE